MDSFVDGSLYIYALKLASVSCCWELDLGIIYRYKWQVSALENGFMDRKKSDALWHTKNREE